MGLIGSPVNSDEPVLSGVRLFEVSEVKVLVTDNHVPGPVKAGGGVVIQFQVAETVVRKLVHLRQEKKIGYDNSIRR